MYETTIYVAAALIRNKNGQYLITRRMPHSNYGGYWEFPGGTIEPGESPEEALVREIKEELNINIETGTVFWHETHKTGSKIIDIRFINCRIEPVHQVIEKIEVTDYKWVGLDELNQFKFPEADEALIRHLTCEQFQD
jgi:8-oxo-dGTP diphosphatase